MKHTIRTLALVAIIAFPPLVAQGQNYVGFSLNYANQQARRQYDDNISVFWNGIWTRQNDGHLHGGQLGIAFFHHLNHGFEIDWGLNFGLHYTSNDNGHTSSATDPDDAFSDYTELTFNLPIHYGYMAPLWYTGIDVGVHTGPSLTVPFYSNYHDDNGYYTDASLFEQDGFNRWNVAWDIGFFFLVVDSDVELKLDFVWSRGLTKHYSSNDFNEYRNLFTVGLQFLFNPE